MSGGRWLTSRSLADPGSGRQPSLRPHVHKQTEKTTRVRTVLNEKQLHTLRTCYAANPRPDALMKEQLVEMTGLSPRVIRVWFQNKRCKDKKKSILMKQLQQQQHNDKTVGVGGLEGRVGWSLGFPASALPFLGRLSGDPGQNCLLQIVCLCAFRARLTLGLEGILIIVSKVRSSPAPAVDRSWGPGLSSEPKAAWFRAPASRGGLCPSLSGTRFEHFPSANPERGWDAALAFCSLAVLASSTEAGPRWLFWGPGCLPVEKAGSLGCCGQVHASPVSGSKSCARAWGPGLKGGGKRKTQLFCLPSSACSAEPPGTDRDAPGGGQPHPPRERRAGQCSRGADVPAAVESAQRVRAPE